MLLFFLFHRFCGHLLSKPVGVALVSAGLESAKLGKADLDLFLYDGAGAPFIRTQGIDCTPSSPAARCPGGATGHTGGYTYADYGKVIGVPEVHADGEIWAQ